MASRFKQQLDALWKIHNRFAEQDAPEGRATADEVFAVIEGLEKIESDIQDVRRTFEAITEYSG